MASDSVTPPAENGHKGLLPYVRLGLTLLASMTTMFFGGVPRLAGPRTASSRPPLAK